MVVSVAEMSKMLERSPSYEPFQDPTTGRPIEGLTTMQMGAHLGISAKDVGRVVQLYGEKAAAIALHQVGRKLEGQRIGFYKAPRAYNLAYQRFMRLPKVAVKRDIAMATKIKAREAGFSTVEKYREHLAVRRELFVKAKPARVIRRVGAPPVTLPIPVKDITKEVKVPIEKFPLRPPAPGETIMIPGVTAKQLEDIRIGRKTQQQVVREIEQRKKVIEVKRRVVEALPREKKTPAQMTNEELQELIELQTIRGRLPDPKYTKELQKRIREETIIKPVIEVAPKLERWLEEVTATPKLRFERNLLKKESKLFDERNKKFESNVVSWDARAKSFSKKYLGRELSAKEYEQALKVQEKLEMERKNLMQQQEGLNLQLQGIETLEKSTGEILKKRPRYLRAATAFAGGFVAAPLGAAVLGMGLLFRPKETIKEIEVGLRREVGVPTMEQVAGFAGGVSFFLLAQAGIGTILRRVGIIKATTRVPPKVHRTVRISKAVKVGERKVWIAGKERTFGRWRLEGRAVTKVIDPTTNKVRDIYHSNIQATFIDAPTKGTAIKQWFEGMSTSYKQSAVKMGFKMGVGETKVQVSIAKAKGTITFSPTDVEKMWRGRGGFEIQELGKAKLTVKGLHTKVVNGKLQLKVGTQWKAVGKMKMGQRYEALADIWAKEISKKAAVHPLKITKKEIILAKGPEYYYSYKALVDVYGVKKARALIHAQELGISKAFIPKEKIYLMGKEFKFPELELKARPFFDKRAELFPPRPEIVQRITPSGRVFQDVMMKPPALKLPPLEAAQITAKAFGKTIGRLMVPKTIQVLKPSVAWKLATVQAAALELTTKQRQELETRQRALQVAFGLEVTPKVAVAPKLAVAPALAFKQVVVPKLKVALAPPVPTPLPPPIAPIAVAEFITGIPIIKLKKETEAEKKRRKAKEAQLRAAALAYQASVGAVALGIAISPEQARKLELERRKFVGLELRPVVRQDRQPSRQVSVLREVQGALMYPAYGTAKKGSPRKVVKALRQKQFELTAPAYATAKRTYTIKKVKKNGKVKKVKVKGPTRGVQMLNLQQSLLNKEMLQYGKGYIAKKKTKKQKKEKRRQTANVARLLLG